MNWGSTKGIVSYIYFSQHSKLFHLVLAKYCVLLNLLSYMQEFHFFLQQTKDVKNLKKKTVVAFHENKRNFLFSQTITRSFSRNFIITSDSRCAIQITTQRRWRLKNLQFVDRSNAIHHIETWHYVCFIKYDSISL